MAYWGHTECVAQPSGPPGWHCSAPPSRLFKSSSSRGILAIRKRDMSKSGLSVPNKGPFTGEALRVMGYRKRTKPKPLGLGSPLRPTPHAGLGRQPFDVPQNLRLLILR